MLSYHSSGLNSAAGERDVAENGALVRAIGDGWMVGLDDLVGLFQPW